MYNDEASMKTMQEKRKFENALAPECSTFWYLWGAFWGYPYYQVNKLFGGDAVREWYKYRCTKD
jgi:hypothetical protein